MDEPDCGVVEYGHYRGGKTEFTSRLLVHAIRSGVCRQWYLAKLNRHAHVVVCSYQEQTPCNSHNR